MSSIGEKIRFLRKDANESQDNLAKIANVSRVSIGNYERDSRTPDAETLRLIAEHYKVALNFLVDNSIDISSVNEYRIQDLSDFLKQLDVETTAPLKRGEYVLTYKDNADKFFQFRGETNSVHNLFDLEDSLHKHGYRVEDNGFTVFGEVLPTYKGVPLTPDLTEKIEKILDTLLS